MNKLATARVLAALINPHLLVKGMLLPGILKIRVAGIAHTHETGVNQP